jgi:hypothetical protein
MDIMSFSLFTTIFSTGESLLWGLSESVSRGPGEVTVPYGTAEQSRSDILGKLNLAIGRHDSDSLEDEEKKKEQGWPSITI